MNSSKRADFIAIVIIVLVVCLLAWAFIRVPELETAGLKKMPPQSKPLAAIKTPAPVNQISPLDVFNAEDRARQTLATIIGGLIFLIGAYMTWRNVRAAEKNAAIAQDKQITDRFTAAVNNLSTAGDDKMATRLGGIYALERIAHDSPDDHWTVMEVLTAYIRDRRPRIEATEGYTEQAEDATPAYIALSTDIQAVLTVIGRRVTEQDTGRTLDLHGVDLRKANLTKANLTNANLEATYLVDADMSEAILTETNLTKARLMKANLTGAFLKEADLTGAFLKEADLTGARLIRTNLKDAELEKVNLVDADLAGVNLAGANLAGVNLAGAKLTKARLMEADLREARLMKANMAGAFLKEANLAGADLRGANLRQAYLIEASLREANLTGADLRRAILAKADLAGANLTKANLTGAFMLNSFFVTQQQIDKINPSGTPESLPPGLYAPINPYDD